MRNKHFYLIITIFLYLVLLSANATASTATKGLRSLQKEETRLARLDKQPINNFESSEKEFSVLSEKDIITYKKLFKYQRQLRRDKVAELIPQLENKVLYGHLMAVRLLHPKTRVPYSDLKMWLDNYNDHFQAKRIYRLANKRKPKSKKVNHNKPKPQSKSIARYSDPDNNIQKPRNKNVHNTYKRRSLIRQIRYALKKKHYLTTEKLLKTNRNKKLLGDSTYSKYSLRLIKKLFYSKQYKSSYRIARRVRTNVTPIVYDAVWFEGLSAYNLGLYSTAARAFRKMADVVPANSRHHTKASYWAGLSYKKAKQYSIGKVFFKQAAKNPHNFYGLVAKAELNEKPNLNWKNPEMSEGERKTLLKNKNVRRVIALAEIGELDLAQKELRAVYSDIPYGMDEALLRMSLDLNLSWNAVTLSHTLLERNKEFLSGLYPDIQSWKPRKATVDYSLINAIVRQESMFSPSVTSSAGAMGLMQIMPSTARHIRQQQGKKVLPRSYVFNPKINIKLGQYYIGYLLEEFNGNLIYSICAYNAGPGNVKKWIARGNAKGGPVEFIESIPFPETKNYVKKVMSNYWVYRNKFGQSLYTLYQTAENRWPKDTYSLVFRLD